MFKVKLLGSAILAVLLGAGITRITYRMIDGAPVNAHDFGAKGNWNGVTGADDTSALQAAINYAELKGLALYVPAGNYKVSASLLVYDVSGFSFSGAGAATTQFTPTTALAGLPVLIVRNVRNSRFSGFAINPVASGAGPNGIQIDRAALGPNGFTSTADTFDGITVGGTTVGIADGVQITSGVNSDNDKHEFTRSFRVVNFTGNGFYIAHSNALWERIHANIDRGPVGIFIFSGSADINAVFGPLISDTEVKVGGGGGFGRHPITVAGNSEQNTTNVTKILTVSDTAVEVRLNGYERQGGATSATNVIDWTGTNGYLQIIGSRLSFGQPNNRLNVTGAGTNVVAIGSELGFDTVNYVGKMTYVGNTWVPGAVTETESGGGTGTFCHLNDFGASFTATPTQCSASIRWALGPAAGYFASTGNVLTLTNADLNLATTTKGVQADSYASSVSGNSATLKGRVATNQTKVAIKLGNSGLLNTATDFLMGLYAGDPAVDPKVMSWGPDGRMTYNTPTTFAALSTGGSTANFTVVGCSDCTIANPCAGGGTGALAKRLNGVWVCN